MCRMIHCGRCNKPTWAGCGAHVEQVLGHLSRDQRCQCRDSQAASKSSGGGWLSSLWK